MKNRIPDYSRWNQLARQFLGEDFFADIMSSAVGEKEPCADVYQGKNEVIVVIDLPGVEDINSLEISVEGETMWIKGYFPTPYQAYQQTLAERKSGEFQKAISLGAPVSKQYSSARYRRGILEIRFPKTGIRKKTHKIRIQTAD
ncbi:Hsp20/alpha crystallin family protein [Paenactinomyces guangxiensis]|uniref:Hsp20/alpha crystallin family protein n=1 Tax=Paenactinomyces guangxiensis TaxID=1490290 RepID=A0A7W1WST8_9BACL|nr:Hsp20/alpha crystallin family protein [Paenactinomyces guangxiensis]MBA4495414.1 Hsp20/alpha crystallin family protein [Paenactinomyces guangxiensis]MBH8592465.1 Hsp20/alpha crystallin family protein [Paenactinomyces guangxiensis]